MKVVIFSGGLGSRLSEETTVRPKPMVEIGGRPILWHIMKSYAQYGFTDFIVLGGYRVELIREYFLNYRMLSANFTIDLSTGEIVWSSMPSEPWRVTVLDTGLETMTGGRLKRARDIIGNETFCLTYGDGLSDIPIDKLVAFHRQGGSWATVAAVEPPGRFGVLSYDLDTQKVDSFREKDGRDVGHINGGFFVCEPEVFDLIDGDMTVWEQEPMLRLVEARQLRAYHHKGYWQNMDTLRDKQVLEAVWQKGAPWIRM